MCLLELKHCSLDINAFRGKLNSAALKICSEKEQEICIELTFTHPIDAAFTVPTSLRG
jgi:hypothetical protein